MMGHTTWLCHVLMKLADGSVAEDTKAQGKPVQLVIGNESLSPAFEAELQDAAIGQTKSFTLEPDQAFGEVQPSQIHHMERDRFPADEPVEEGAIMMFTQPSGEEVPGIIREIVGSSVTIDFNHPLAGHTVSFEVEILENLS